MHQDGCKAKRRLDIGQFCVRGAFAGIVLGLHICKSFVVSLFCSTTCIFVPAAFVSAFVWDGRFLQQPLLAAVVQRPCLACSAERVDGARLNHINLS